MLLQMALYSGISYSVIQNEHLGVRQTVSVGLISNINKAMNISSLRPPVNQKTANENIRKDVTPGNIFIKVIAMVDRFDPPTLREIATML